MLRITITDGPVEQRWVLQGRLVRPWVAELEASWKQSRSPHDSRKCVVDLSEVTLIDKRGEKALKTMRRAGAELIACGVYTKHVVEGINSQCKRRFRNLLGCLLVLMLWPVVPANSFGQLFDSTPHVAVRAQPPTAEEPTTQFLVVDKLAHSQGVSPQARRSRHVS